MPPFAIAGDVSKSVRRKANHEIILGTARGGLSSITPQTGEWGELPAPILVRDFRACGEAMRRASKAISTRRRCAPRR